MWNFNKPNDDLSRLQGKVEGLEQKIKDLESRLARPRPQKRLLGTKEACMYLNVSRMTLYRYMNEGILAYNMVGKQRRIALSDLDELLERSRKESLPTIL